MYKVLYDSTPSLDDYNVIQIANILVAAKPVAVPVVPEDYCIRLGCYANVLEKIKRNSGKLVAGWEFYKLRDELYTAAHHAVWEFDGTLIDVTPVNPAGLNPLARLEDFPQLNPNLTVFA